MVHRILCTDLSICLCCQQLNGEFLGITTAIEQELVGVAGPAQHLPESAGTTLDQSLSCPQPIVVDKRRALGPNAAADVASSVSGARSESSHPVSRHLQVKMNK